MRKIIIFFLVFFNINIVYGCEVITHKKLTLEESKQLLEDVQYLLSDQETIDYEDSRLNEILNKYGNKYNLFKIYKAFIEFDKSDKTLADVNRAKEALSGIYYHHLNCCCYGLNVDSNEDLIEKLLSLMSVQNNYFDLEEVMSKQLRKDIRTYVAIPLWLVLKYPNILDYNNDRWSLGMKVNCSVQNLSSFNILETHLKEATGNCWHHYKGSRSLDKLTASYNLKLMLSFAPSLIYNSSKQDKQQLYYPDEPYLDFELWSYEGIWNRLKYKQVFGRLDRAAYELAEYYRNNYDLKKHAPYAKFILSNYIRHEIPGVLLENNPPEESFWYPDFFHYYQIISKLEFFKDDISLIKNFTKHLLSKEKGFVLLYSVLKDYDISFINYLIEAGANINVAPCGETPLIASVTTPRIMNLLLKSGANIHIKNRFGKNVLFYAVQFGNLETVEILLENGAKSIINSQIYDRSKIIEDMDALSNFSSYPTMISNFTPLIYAKRYASQEIIDLLIKNGAKDGPADPQKVQEWIEEGPLDL